MTKNGLNPLIEASCILYEILVKQGIASFKTKPEAHTFVKIDGISLNDKISVEMSDSTVWTFSINQILYGKRTHPTDFTKRLDECANYGIMNPWIAAQLYFRTMGMYLIDLSDCTKVTTSGKHNYDQAFFRLYSERPEKMMPLWHKHSIIPYFHRDDLTLESPELSTMWMYTSTLDELPRIIKKKMAEQADKASAAAEVAEEDVVKAIAKAFAAKKYAAKTSFAKRHAANASGDTA